MSWRRYAALVLWAATVDFALYECWIAAVWIIGRLGHRHS